MLLAGIKVMVFGQDKLLQFLQLIQDGYIYLQTHYHFTMSFLVYKDSSLDKLQLGQMGMRAHLIIGFMKDQIKKPHGYYLKEFGDG